MLFVINCKDKPGMLETRKKLRDEHRAYLAATPVKIVVKGPLVGDDGETMLGSLLMVDVENRAAAEAFNRNDPFSKAGVWGEVEITGFVSTGDYP